MFAKSPSGSATARFSRAPQSTFGSASPAGFHIVKTVHLIATHGTWRWILPPTKYREYKADSCPTDAGSTPPPTTS